MTKLKLIAQTQTDVNTISALTQDAIIRISDIDFQPRAQQFVMMLTRFQWERQSQNYRTRAALLIRNVIDVRQKFIIQENTDALLSLLAIRFTPTRPKPSGVLELLFSGGGVIECHVEAIALALEDTSAPWKTRAKPHHK